MHLVWIISCGKMSKSTWLINNNNLNASHVSFPFRAARPESSVDDLEASLSDATVATLTWKRPERPNGRVSSYRIKMFYQDYAGRPHQRQISVPGDMTSISLPNLEVYTRYRLAANISASHIFSQKSTIHTFNLSLFRNNWIDIWVSFVIRFSQKDRLRHRFSRRLT